MLSLLILKNHMTKLLLFPLLAMNILNGMEKYRVEVKESYMDRYGTIKQPLMIFLIRKNYPIYYTVFNDIIYSTKWDPNTPDTLCVILKNKDSYTIKIED